MLQRLRLHQRFLVEVISALSDLVPDRDPLPAKPELLKLPGIFGRVDRPDRAVDHLIDGLLRYLFRQVGFGADAVCWLTTKVQIAKDTEYLLMFKEGKRRWIV